MRIGIAHLRFAGAVEGIVPAAHNAVEELYGPSSDGIAFFTSIGTGIETGASE